MCARLLEVQELRCRSPSAHAEQGSRQVLAATFGTMAKYQLRKWGLLRYAPKDPHIFYIYIYTHVCIYTHIHLHTETNIYTYVYIYTYICTDIRYLGSMGSVRVCFGLLATPFFTNWGPFCGCPYRLIVRALLFAVYIRAPIF